MKTCPQCHTKNPNDAELCTGCQMSFVPEPDLTAASGIMMVMIGCSLVCVVLGFVVPDTVFQEVTLFALAAVFGILARIAQASKQHDQMMRK